MRVAYTPEMVESLEQQLKLSLTPVKPNQEFVSTLQTRLSNPVRMQVERRDSWAFGMLLIAGSMLGGVLIVWLLRQLRAS